MRKSLSKWFFSPLAGVLLSKWKPFLIKNFSSIPPSYWPRTIFTTGMSIFNSLISIHESNKYGGQLKSIKVEKPIFIIGHHRSGTTYLWNLIATNPKLLYPKVPQTIFPETFLTFHSVAEKLARKFGPDKRPQDNVRRSADAPMSEEWGISASTFLSTHMVRHFPKKRNEFKKYLTMRNADESERDLWKKAFDQFCRKLLLNQPDNTTLLFKAPTHTAKIKLILELYPDARFIHIHRDPYRVFKSTMKMEQKALPLCTYQNVDYDDLEDYVIWRYKTMYNAFFRDIDLIPTGQFTEVSYSEAESNPIQVVEKIYKDLNMYSFKEVLPSLKNYISSIADYQKNSYPELSASLKYRLENEWGSHFKNLGYPMDNSTGKDKNYTFDNIKADLQPTVSDSLL